MSRAALIALVMVVFAGELAWSAWAARSEITVRWADEAPRYTRTVTNSRHAWAVDNVTLDAILTNAVWTVRRGNIPTAPREVDN